VKAILRDLTPNCNLEHFTRINLHEKVLIVTFQGDSEKCSGARTFNEPGSVSRTRRQRKGRVNSIADRSLSLVNSFGPF
jgi:hypothetical protein